MTLIDHRQVTDLCPNGSATLGRRHGVAFGDDGDERMTKSSSGILRSSNSRSRMSEEGHFLPKFGVGVRSALEAKAEVADGR